MLNLWIITKRLKLLTILKKLLKQKLKNSKKVFRLNLDKTLNRQAISNNNKIIRKYGRTYMKKDSLLNLKQHLHN